MRLFCWLLGHKWVWAPLNGLMVEKCARCGRIYRLEQKGENLNDM